MKIGIVGLDLAGKKTLFNILTGNGKNMVKKGSVELALTTVDDDRITELAKVYNPKKTTYAQLEFILTPSITREERGSAKTLNAIHSVDGIIIVVKDYSFGSNDKSSPVNDFNFIYNEIVFNDFINVGTNLEKINKQLIKIKDSQLKQEREILEKIREWLEKELPLSQCKLNPDEVKLLRKYDFLSIKPYMVLVNIDEKDIGSPKKYDFKNAPYETLSLKIESEINLLEKDEQREFLESLGLKESGLSKLIRKSYQIANLISFFTVGDDEVKAWTIKNGISAKEASGKIHSDIEKGFIRAEVIHYDDFIKAGSEKEAKKLNLYRIEGKDYIVNDGDIINFRFNV